MGAWCDEGRNRDEGREWAAALGQGESEQVQGGKITTINKASPCNLSLIWLSAFPAFSFFCMLISMSYFLSEICLCFYPCPCERTSGIGEGRVRATVKDLKKLIKKHTVKNHTWINDFVSSHKKAQLHTAQYQLMQTAVISSYLHLPKSAFICFSHGSFIELNAVK